MKRWLFKLALFLFLGAIINVAVAWGFVALQSSISRSDITAKGRSSGKEFSKWETTKFEFAGSLRVTSSWRFNDPDVWQVETGFEEFTDVKSESLIPHWADFLHPLQGELSRGRFEWMADGRGWPFLSMWGGCKTTYASSLISGGAVKSYSPAKAFSVRSLLLTKCDPSRWYAYDIKLLPMAPIWPGFAINTIFYAAVLWMLTLGPFTARSMIRRKRSLCIKCGYDLRGMNHDKCPECGQ